MDSNSLKQQFNSLQESQQKKLAKLKVRKEAKEKTKESNVRSSHSFGINDDLDLKLADPPDTSIYSEELVAHLNDQIRQMKDETGRLYKLLSERDFEIRQMKKKSERGVNENGNIGSDAAAVKIVDLSKKIRELTSELESERTKSKQLKRMCNDLEIKLSNDDSGPLQSARTSASDATQNANEVKSLQDKLKQSEMKLAEQRNQNQSLRNEVKVFQKVLNQEIGENIPVQSLLTGTSGWRGRAQQIIALQKKVNELKCQLGEVKSKRSDLELDADLEDQFMGSASSRLTASSVDIRGRKNVQRMEKERKEAQERMLNEMKALEQDHETLKGKFDATKARNKILSNEVKAMKQQVTTLIDKGKHDDELVSALLKQQEQLKLSIEANTEKQRELENVKKDTLHKLSTKSLQENNIVEQLKAIVAEKEAKVHQLEQDLENTRRQNSEEHGMNAIFERVERPSTSESRPQSVIAEVVDVNTSPSNTFIVDSPPSRQSALLSDRSSSRNSRPASANNLVLELNELKLQCQEYKSLCQAATVERDRLSELVQVLEGRISHMTVSSTDAQAEILHQRKRNAHLEKQLGKVKVEQGSSTGRRGKIKGMTASSISLRESLVVDDLGGDLEEMQVNLEIQQDENKALKAALQSTLQAKDEDIKLYAQMMDETKAVFLQGLRQYRQGNS